MPSRDEPDRVKVRISVPAPDRSRELEAIHCHLLRDHPAYTENFDLLAAATMSNHCIAVELSDDNEVLSVAIGRACPPLGAGLFPIASRSSLGNGAVAYAALLMRFERGWKMEPRRILVESLQVTSLARFARMLGTGASITVLAGAMMRLLRQRPSIILGREDGPSLFRRRPREQPRCRPPR